MTLDNARRFDLHLHTNRSDGRFEPEEVLRRCAASGLEVVALTDHPLGPLTTNSSVCFHVEDAAVHDFRSLGASMCLVQTLVVGLGAET